MYFLHSRIPPVENGRFRFRLDFFSIGFFWSFLSSVSWSVESIL